MSPHPDACILVVDDEPGVLETITAILAAEGQHVADATSVDQALRRLGSERFDVVLTDLRLEGASGISLLSELRRNWPETVAVVLTGYASVESAVEALREGAYDYLMKPCHVDELKATVARAVERGMLSRSLRERMEELDAANARIRTLAQDLQQRVDEATAELTNNVKELAEAKRDLEQTQRQREEFISMVAHELGQPLTTITAYAQLLERANLRPDIQERARTMLVVETRRLNRLVQDLSDATRLVAGHFKIGLADCNLAEIVREQVELAQMGAERHTFALDEVPEAAPARCDRDRIAQVLSNLLTNAVSHTPGGHIRVGLHVDDGHGLLTVSDQGPGIPRDRLEAIFAPYTRLPRGGSGKPKGSGLGLYIARGIVEAHGGRIWAESAEGQGTTIVVRLPLEPKNRGA